MGVNQQTSVPAFTSGQVLTAQQQTEINTGVPVFADSTARDAGFGGAGEKVLAEGQLCYLESTNVVQYYDGSNWATLGPTGAPTQAFFREEQASGTYGGSSTSGSFQKRVLNTTVVNGIVGCSIASSVVTLPAGSYHAVGYAPTANGSGAVSLRLQNTSDNTTIGFGTNTSTAGGSECTIAVIDYYFTLAAPKDVELQTRVATSVATDGLGVRTNFGNTEVYSQLTITKVA
jgi:hypothetical protein